MHAPKVFGEHIGNMGNILGISLGIIGNKQCFMHVLYQTMFHACLSSNNVSCMTFIKQWILHWLLSIEGGKQRMYNGCVSSNDLTLVA